jgi:ribosome biogenesis protein MAK21
MDEDSDDLLDLDDMPNIPLTSAFPDSADEEEELELGGKRKRGADDKERKKKRRLPTLASAEDYAALINDGPEEDL